MLSPVSVRTSLHATFVPLLTILLLAALPGCKKQALKPSDSSATTAPQVDVHDPVIAREGNHWYLFSTGPGITIYRSEDRIHWRRQGKVLEQEPEWAQTVSPGFDGHFWAPDVIEHEGMFYLYYSVSAFGKNASGMGVAVNKTLNPESPDYQWVDKGLILQSVPERDEWNAIDPQIIFDEEGTPWMAFGSFWRGLKLVKMQDNLIELAEPQQWHTLARRDPPSAVEAPFIYQHGDYYYLFTSWDKCCRGADSTYKVMVGRARKIGGPYVDKKGRELTEGGGSLVIDGNARWPGLGHNAVYNWDGQDVLVMHAYEAADNGLQKLKIMNIRWDDQGWPVVDPAELDSYQSVLIQ